MVWEWRNQATRWGNSSCVGGQIGLESGGIDLPAQLFQKHTELIEAGQLLSKQREEPNRPQVQIMLATSKHTQILERPQPFFLISSYCMFSNLYVLHFTTAYVLTLPACSILANPRQYLPIKQLEVIVSAQTAGLRAIFLNGKPHSLSVIYPESDFEQVYLCIRHFPIQQPCIASFLSEFYFPIELLSFLAAKNTSHCYQLLVLDFLASSTSPIPHTCLDQTLARVQLWLC